MTIAAAAKVISAVGSSPKREGDGSDQQSRGEQPVKYGVEVVWRAAPISKGSEPDERQREADASGYDDIGDPSSPRRYPENGSSLGYQGGGCPRRASGGFPPSRSDLPNLPWREHLLSPWQWTRAAPTRLTSGFRSDNKPPRRCSLSIRAGSGRRRGRRRALLLLDGGGLSPVPVSPSEWCSSAASGSRRTACTL